MSRVFKEYLKEHNNECPRNAHLLVQYSKKHNHFKDLSWMDAHILIENYVLNDKIIEFESDSADEFEESKYSQDLSPPNSPISKLSLTAKTRQMLNKYSIVNGNNNRKQQRIDWNGLYAEKYNKSNTSNSYVTIIRQQSGKAILTRKVMNYWIKCAKLFFILFCSLLITFVGWMLILLGQYTKSYGDEFNIKGLCICSDTKGPVRIWNIYNNTLCVDTLAKNEYFIEYYDSNNKYKEGDIVGCYTNEDCDDVYLTLTNENHKDGTDLYFGGIFIMAIAFVCFVGTIVGNCKVNRWRKCCACVYLKHCCTYHCLCNTNEIYVDKINDDEDDDDQIGGLDGVNEYENEDYDDDDEPP